MKIVLFFIVIVFLFGAITPQIYAESVPKWVKNTAGWWATDAISETEFVNAIEFLVNEGIITTEIKVNGDTNKSYIFCDSQEINPNLNDFERELLCTNTDMRHIYLNPDFSSGQISYNQLGFRGSEFTVEKKYDSYRIIAVGGSTTEGVSPNDTETYPSFLEKIFHEHGFYNVEVINAGISSASSFDEKNLIKNKLVDYSPDMIIVYDGWNDLRTYLGEPEGINVSREPNPEKSNPTLWKNRWIEFCDNHSNDFKTIIVLQPLLGLSEKLLTNYEYSMLLKNLSMIIGDAPEYDNYARQLPELSYACTNSFDFRKIFDKTAETIFIDTGHVSVQGEKILAQHMFNAILPHVDPSLNPSQYEEIFSNPYKKFQIESEYDFRGRVINNESFSETDLHNGVYWFGEISFVDYINNNMNNADFTYSFLSDVIFSENEAIENKFGRSTIIKTSFLNNNFEASDFSGARILESVFRNDSMNKNLFEGSTIKNTIFENVDLSDSVFNITYFENVKFKTITTANLEITNSHFINTDFVGFDFSKISSNNNNFAGCDFTGTNLNKIDNWHHDFTAKVTVDKIMPGSNLSNLDLSGINFAKTSFSYENGNEEDYDLAKYFMAVKISNSDLSSSNFSNKNLVFIDFSYSDFKNANLSFTDMRYADLEGANLEGANLEGANLEGAILEGANLNCINHEICN